MTGAATVVDVFFHGICAAQLMPLFDRHAAVTPRQWLLSSRDFYLVPNHLQSQQGVRLRRTAGWGKGLPRTQAVARGRDVFGNRRGRIYRVEHSRQPQ